MTLNYAIYGALFLIGAAIPPLFAWVVFVAPYYDNRSVVWPCIGWLAGGLTAGFAILFGFLWLWAAQWGPE